MKLLKKIVNFVLFVGLIAFLVEMIDKLFMREETERIGMVIDMEPKRQSSKEDKKPENDDDEPDAMLDILEDMNEKDRAEQVKKLTEKLHEEEAFESPEDLTEREEKIMKLFDKHDEIDTSLLSDKIEDVSVRTLRRDLDNLEEKGVVKKIGKTKGSYYIRA